MYDEILKEIEQFLIRTQLRLTAVMRDNTPIDQEKFSRFERFVTIIHAARKHDPDGVIVIRFGKLVAPEFGLKSRDRVYFEPEARKWFAITQDGKEIVFRPELVGEFYLTDREQMERFGFVIAGNDVRRICFRALYKNGKDMFQSPLDLAGVMNKRGAASDAYAKSLSEEHAEWFVPEERELIEEYLGTR